MIIRSITLSVLSLVMASSSLANTRTLNDSREYLEYDSAISGIVGCQMPADMPKPDLDNPAECRVARTTATVGGEHLVRDDGTGLCTLSIFNSTPGLTVQDDEGKTLTLPGAPPALVGMQATVYACDYDGRKR